MYAHEEALGMAPRLLLHASTLGFEHPRTGERIMAGGWRFDFERGTGGPAESFTVNAGRVTNIRFVRR